MDVSIFQDKTKIPDIDELKKTLTNTFEFWPAIRDYALEKFPKATEEWKYMNKHGWSFRIKDSKRVIIYMLPRDKFFKVALIFGQKAYDEIMKSPVSDLIKKELQEAKVNVEGRGIRISIDQKALPDIKKLIDIKLKY